MEDEANEDVPSADYPGYQLETGMACYNTGDCEPGTNAGVASIMLTGDIGANKHLVYDMHRHPNVGLSVIGGRGPADVYTEGASPDDLQRALLTSQMSSIMGLSAPPSYIFSKNLIHKVTFQPGGPPNVEVFNRWKQP